MELGERLILPLLAVKMLGGRSVPEDSPALKEVKKALAEVVELGLVRKETVRIPDPSKPARKGKPATKNQKVVHLTEEGEGALREAASPEALAATSGGRWEGCARVWRRTDGSCAPKWRPHSCREKRES